MFKKQSIFSFIAVLFMPPLSEHEQIGAIGMLRAGMRISDVARYHNCHPSTRQHLRIRYQATATVKDRRRSVLPRTATGVKSQVTLIVYRRYPFQLGTASARRIVGLQG